MKVHHGYIGVLLILWSSITAVSGWFTIGNFNPWLALAGFVVGGSLLAHDLWYHLGRKSNENYRAAG